LQAAHREDFQACALHSMSFGNEGGELSNVGKQLVLVNYRQYAAVIIFFILLGAHGVIFYSLVKEWALHLKRERVDQSASTSIDAEQANAESSAQEHSNSEQANSEQQNADEQYIEDSSAQAEVSPIKPAESDVNRLLFIIDWLPVRITAFGFLVVGHFTHAMSAWFDILLNPNISTYDALAKVSKAAEDVSNCDSHLHEPLQLVRLVKRNIIFLLMAVSLLTMVGLVA
jgi:AmpE protein